MCWGFSLKLTFSKNLSVSNSLLYPDRDQHSVGPDLGPKLSDDEKSPLALRS